MRHWRPKPGIGLWIALVLLLASAGGIVVFAMRLLPVLAQSPDQWRIDIALYGNFIGLVALGLLSGFLLYRIIGVLTMTYEMDRNGLYIYWIGNRAVVPLAQIESMDSGAPGARVGWPLLHRIGYNWGRGRTNDGRCLHLFSTVSLRKSLVVYTADEAYAISPLNQDTFVQELEQRRRLGAVKSLTPTVEPARIFFYAFWNDPLVRGALLVAFGLNLLALGIIAYQYPGLAEMVPIRFNAAGELADLRPRHQLIFLAMAAFALSLLNALVGIALYRRTRVGATLLQCGSVLVQVLFGVAILAAVLQ
jgi:hypothetical protein